MIRTTQCRKDVKYTTAASITDALVHKLKVFFSLSTQIYYYCLTYPYHHHAFLPITKQRLFPRDPPRSEPAAPRSSTFYIDGHIGSNAGHRNRRVY